MWLTIVAVLTVFVFQPTLVKAEEPFTFGLLLVGPYNDHGWSQAHFEAGKYVEEKLPNAKMLYIDKVNPADRGGDHYPAG